MRIVWSIEKLSEILKTTPPDYNPHKPVTIPGFRHPVPPRGYPFGPPVLLDPKLETWTLAHNPRSFTSSAAGNWIGVNSLDFRPGRKRIEVKPGNLGTLHSWSIVVPVRVVRRVQIPVRGA